MKEVTYNSNGESITLTAEDLEKNIGKDYKPYGGLEDNYFFCLRFDGMGFGKAVFVFSELGEDFSDVSADTFSVDEKSSGKIVLTFTNGSALVGTKTKNTLTLSGGGVSYVFEKV